jgi:hypothetical protein
MADNVTALANTGTGTDVFATDDIGGVNYPRTKVGFGVDGSYEDASATNPLPVQAYGELVEAIEAMRFAIASLTKTIGYALPNASGFPIMEARQATASNLQVTVGSIAGGQTIATVSTVSTVTNQSQIGGFSANDQIPAFMHLQADSLRRNISVT